jgi:hypothetical protein
VWGVGWGGLLAGFNDMAYVGVSQPTPTTTNNNDTTTNNDNNNTIINDDERTWK